MRARGARAAPAVGLSALLAGCGNPGQVECACADPTIAVELPPDRAAQVTQVVLSGVACAGAVATCTKPAAAGCSEFVFRATAPGRCDVDVQFASGPADFLAQVDFVRVSCCPGLYAPSLAGSTIDVPSLAGDAGPAG